LDLEMRQITGYCETGLRRDESGLRRDESTLRRDESASLRDLVKGRWVALIFQIGITL
jgi:hypothetical protein